MYLLDRLIRGLLQEQLSAINPKYLLPFPETKTQLHFDVHFIFTHIIFIKCFRTEDGRYITSVEIYILA